MDPFSPSSSSDAVAATMVSPTMVSEPRGGRRRMSRPGNEPQQSTTGARKLSATRHRRSRRSDFDSLQRTTSEPWVGIGPELLRRDCDATSRASTTVSFGPGSEQVRSLVRRSAGAANDNLDVAWEERTRSRGIAFGLGFRFFWRW